MKTAQYLEQEIERLRIELLETIPQEIQEAAAGGDLRENAEFSAAVARQNFVGMRLEQLIKRLYSYKKININSIPKNEVSIGSVIKLRNLQTKEIEYVKIVVGDDIDDDTAHQSVTINSPMGKALVGKKEKEEVQVTLPKHKIQYKILKLTTIHDLTL